MRRRFGRSRRSRRRRGGRPLRTYKMSRGGIKL